MRREFTMKARDVIGYALGCGHPVAPRAHVTFGADSVSVSWDEDDELPYWDDEQDTYNYDADDAEITVTFEPPCDHSKRDKAIRLALSRAMDSYDDEEVAEHARLILRIAGIDESVSLESVRAIRKADDAANFQAALERARQGPCPERMNGRIAAILKREGVI